MIEWVLELSHIQPGLHHILHGPRSARMGLVAITMIVVGHVTEHFHHEHEHEAEREREQEDNIRIQALEDRIAELEGFQVDLEAKEKALEQEVGVLEEKEHQLEEEVQQLESLGAFDLSDVLEWDDAKRLFPSARIVRGMMITSLKNYEYWGMEEKEALMRWKSRLVAVGCDIREGKPSICFAHVLDANSGTDEERARLLDVIRADREETGEEDIAWVIVTCSSSSAMTTSTSFRMDVPVSR